VTLAAGYQNADGQQHKGGEQTQEIVMSIPTMIRRSNLRKKSFHS